MSDSTGNTATATRVFLSYARGDDEPFVKRLHADLAKAGFTVWFDRESLMSRGLNFHQEIKDAIRTELDRVIYVGGPNAALSAFVRAEWQFALECDHVVVTPILRLGDYEHVPGELSLLHCEDFRDDANYPAALAKLIASLRQPNPKLGALFAVPNLPPNFLGRPELMRRVRDALLVDLQKPQVITGADPRVGMQGMGGIGKSVLAAALARNRQVRQAYPDGVVWIAAGQKLTDDDLLKRQRDLARHLGGDGTFASLAQGQGVLRQLLAAKAVLLVLDDVWRAADAQAFDVIGPRCRMLVTTRDKGILDALHGELVPVSLFTEPEALQLLADAVNVAPAALPAEAREVARECGLLPLALALCGGMARKRGGDFHSVLERLRRADLEKIADRESINEQHRSIWCAMQASVEMLPDDQQQRFAELSVFATDQTVPEAAAATLWSHTGNLDDLDTEELLINLVERSLVQLDQKTEADGKVRRRFRLHDLLHDYAVRIAGEPRAVHQKLLDAYRKKCIDGWPTGPNDGYFFENLVHHRAETGAWPQTEKLVTDFSWLMRKCELGLLDSISNDYELIRESSPTEMNNRLEIWSDFFREKAHILRRGNEEWQTHKILLQLAVEHADDSPLTLSAERWLAEGHCDWPWLRRAGGRLKHITPSPCLRTFEHPGRLRGARMFKNGQLLSWGDVMRMWDIPSGKSVVSFEGHRGEIVGALELADGRVLSWSSDTWSESGDKTLRTWDSRSGACLAILEGHSSNVVGALELPSGRILSWSGDKTLRLWDGKRGALLRTFEGHADKVHGAVALPDGRLLSWSEDHTLRLWNWESAAVLHTLAGHEGKILGALALTDGRVVSWSEDHTLRLWDTQSGALLWAFNESKTTALGVLPLFDGRLLSWWRDGRLRLWDGHSGKPLQILVQRTDEGANYVEVDAGAQVLANEHLLSWTSDGMLRLWDAKSGALLRTLRGSGPHMDGAKALADGRIVTWDPFGTLQLWDMQSGGLLGTLRGHARVVLGVHELDRQRVLSWSEDGTLRLWDARGDEPGGPPEGHTNDVAGARFLADGRILSWSGDKTLRLWDGEKGACLAVLEGHTDGVEGAMAMADGRLLSWSRDTTLRTWNGQTGKCLEMIPEEEMQPSHSDLAALRSQATRGSHSQQWHVAIESDKAVVLRSHIQLRPLACWQAACDCFVEELASSGIVLVAQEDFQVCVLHLYVGDRRLTLPELERSFPTPSEFPLLRLVAPRRLRRPRPFRGHMTYKEETVNCGEILKQANLLYQQRNFDEATARLRELERVYRSLSDQSMLAACLVRQAEILLDQGGHRNEAMGKFDEATALYTSLNMPDRLIALSGLKLRLKIGTPLWLMRLLFWFAWLLLLLLALGLLRISLWFLILTGPLVIFGLLLLAIASSPKLAKRIAAAATKEKPEIRAPMEGPSREE